MFAGFEFITALVYDHFAKSIKKQALKKLIWRICLPQFGAKVRNKTRFILVYRFIENTQLFRNEIR